MRVAEGNDCTCDPFSDEQHTVTHGPDAGNLRFSRSAHRELRVSQQPWLKAVCCGMEFPCLDDVHERDRTKRMPSQQAQINM